MFAVLNAVLLLLLYFCCTKKRAVTERSRLCTWLPPPLADLCLAYLPATHIVSMTVLSKKTGIRFHANVPDDRYYAESNGIITRAVQWDHLISFMGTISYEPWRVVLAKRARFLCRAPACRDTRIVPVGRVTIGTRSYGFFCQKNVPDSWEIRALSGTEMQTWAETGIVVENAARLWVFTLCNGVLIITQKANHVHIWTWSSEGLRLTAHVLLEVAEHRRNDVLLQPVITPDALLLFESVDDSSWTGQGLWLHKSADLCAETFPITAYLATTIEASSTQTEIRDVLYLDHPDEAGSFVTLKIASIYLVELARNPNGRFAFGANYRSCDCWYPAW